MIRTLVIIFSLLVMYATAGTTVRLADGVAENARPDRTHVAVVLRHLGPPLRQLEPGERRALREMDLGAPADSVIQGELMMTHIAE
ncbi:MAG: hypothetical protein GF331_12890 [Chitinivibrionales bacterium]|nr:hypothetical protein [Chitinivibrionales bacterium]